MTTITDEDYVYILHFTPYSTSTESLHSVWHSLEGAQNEAAETVTRRTRSKTPVTLRWDQQVTGEWVAEAVAIDANYRITQWQIRR